MFRNKQNANYGVIGLGRFGFALAKTLAESGKEILVIDNNENKIKAIRDYTENAYVVSSLDKETLEDTGMQNCDTVIVCIGESIDVSILTTLNVISLGVKRVISKAFSYEHGLVLEKLGAEVVYPETDMAVRLAKKLLSPNILESIELRDDIAISELNLTAKIAGKTVLEANLRQKYKLNIIAMEQQGKTTTEITPNFKLNVNDKMVVIGNRENIKRFEAFLYDNSLDKS